MRINNYIAYCTGVSRRAADQAIVNGHVKLNDEIASLGASVSNLDKVSLDGKLLNPPPAYVTIMLNKPPGYVVSRSGQGNHTVFELLPPAYRMLKPVGRLDKESTGLLLLSNNGQLAQQLTHPSAKKYKVYKIQLDKPLSKYDQRIIEKGVKLEDGVSKLALNGEGKIWSIVMHEGRNRQIRRTFAILGYSVTKLHRVQFGNYFLEPTLETGNYKVLDK